MPRLCRDLSSHRRHIISAHFCLGFPSSPSSSPHSSSSSSSASSSSSSSASSSSSSFISWPNFFLSLIHLGLGLGLDKILSIRVFAFLCILHRSFESNRVSDSRGQRTERGNSYQLSSIFFNLGNRCETEKTYYGLRLSESVKVGLRTDILSRCFITPSQ